MEPTCSNEPARRATASKNNELLSVWLVNVPAVSCWRSGLLQTSGQKAVRRGDLYAGEVQSWPSSLGLASRIECPARPGRRENGTKGRFVGNLRSPRGRVRKKKCGGR